MRRGSTLLVLLTVVGVVIASSATARAARTSASQMVVCPLRAQATEPCCGPPVANARAAATTPCCASAQTACAPATLTLAVSRNPLTAGQSAKLTGALSSGLAGTTVELWQEQTGGSFELVAHTTTGTGGGYSFSRKVETNVEWYTSAGSDVSPQVGEDVGVKVTVRTLRSTRPHFVRELGHLSPRQVGTRVLVERKTGRGWVVIKRTRTNRSSDFKFSSSTRSNGNATLRVIVPATERNIRSQLTIMVSRVSG